MIAEPINIMKAGHHSLQFASRDNNELEMLKPITSSSI